MTAAADEVHRCFERSEYVNNLVASLAELLYLPAFLAVIAVAWATGVGLSSLLVFLLLLYRMQPALKRLDGARVALAGFAPSVAAVADLRASTTSRWWRAATPSRRDRSARCASRTSRSPTPARLRPLSQGCRSSWSEARSWRWSGARAPASRR
jgi:hypothetical protein